MIASRTHRLPTILRFIPSKSQIRCKVFVPTIPTNDDEFVGKDLRKLSNKHFINYKAHHRARSMARQHQVIPEVVRDFSICANLVVEYGPGRWDMVYRGNILDENQVANVPKVTFPMDGLRLKNDDPLWTLLLMDADASHGQGQQLHWLMNNIPSGDKVQDGNTIVPFTPGVPPIADGLHRYVFLLLLQKQGHQNITAENLEVPFCAEAFMMRNVLQPCGISFYRTQIEQSATVKDTNFTEERKSRYAGL